MAPGRFAPALPGGVRRRSETRKRAHVCTLSPPARRTSLVFVKVGSAPGGVPSNCQMARLFATYLAVVGRLEAAVCDIGGACAQDHSHCVCSCPCALPDHVCYICIVHGACDVGVMQTIHPNLGQGMKMCGWTCMHMYALVCIVSCQLTSAWMDLQLLLQ